MNDEQYTPSLGTWLKDTDITPPDPQTSARRIMTQLPESEKRRSWWPFRRQTTSSPTPAMPDTEYQATPIPATNGHTPTVTRRTQSMFSPAKAITAGVLVFAIGGVLLIAQPFDQQGGSVPGAEAPIAAPVEVTGRFIDAYGAYEQQGGDMETLPGESGVFTNSGTVSASDPRLEGTLAFIVRQQGFVGNGLETSERLTAACETDADCADGGGPYLWVHHRANSIENDEGVWRQRPSVGAFFPCSAGSDTWVDVYDGEGGYDGLIAVLEFSDSGGSVPFYGFILDARQLPPAPENASTK